MKDTLLQTPEGVRDIYGLECDEKRCLMDDIHNVLKLYGNQDIETPHFEFFDIFNRDKGSAPSTDMYKFFDRENNTLVLRPDITPSIARSVAKYYQDVELPIRLCYEGHTFKNTHQHQGKLSEENQVGCEFFNDDSSAADADILACAIDCLKAAGLEDFRIEIGEADFFKGIISAAGIDSETEHKITEYIKIKNFFGLREYISKIDIPEDVKKVLTSLDKLFGGPQMLGEAEKLVSNERSLSAIDRLRKVNAALSYYGYQDYIGFDLSMIHGYNYYTGIVFRGFTYGTGNPVVKGGRYNNLLSQFGKEAPSIGFAIYIDELMNALRRQKIDMKHSDSISAVIYDIDSQKYAVKLAADLRGRGCYTDLIRKSKKHDVDEYKDYFSKLGYDKILIVNPDGDYDEIVL